jgi:integrase
MMGFPHVTAMRDRHGKIRYRYRRKGCKTTYLPGKPGEPAFAEAYARAVAGETSKVVVGASRTLPGTMNALAVAIYNSAEWAQMAPTTQTTYRGIIERIRTDLGTLPVRSFTTARVLALRDKKRDTPAAANNFIKILRWMMSFAVSRNLRTDNPCIGIKPLKVEGDGFHTWTEEEIAAFEKRWPVGTRERVAFDLLLWTIQRSGDVRVMGRQHMRGGRLEFTQEKTGADLSLPIMPQLAASLAKVPATQMLFVQTEAGVPFTAKGFGNWFSAACRSAGLPQCSAHGLRKSGATRLADAGCSEAEIMAWTGHQTTKEVQRYTRKRNQKGLADRAAQRTQGEQEMANPENRLAK